MSQIIEDYNADSQLIKDISQYKDEMQNACKVLKSAIDVGRGLMKDDVSKEAFKVLEDLSVELLSGLPDTDGLVIYLGEQMKKITEAHEIKFR